MIRIDQALDDTIGFLAAPRTRAVVVRTSATEDRAPIPYIVRYTVMRRDRFQCVWCGDADGLEMDHIIPWSAGGPDTLENLRTLCRRCNEDRSNYVGPLDQQYVHGLECLRCEPDLAEEKPHLETLYCLRCHARGLGHPYTRQEPA
ncbi:HNH endonuclease [Gordonia sp. SND2]|uniref:HNH endonuclease n=1 Tax=Gordonia sp. SND2 TaxID=3388659 RepID=UPI00398B73AE